MPLYEYECLKCGQRTEKIEGFSGRHLRKCPKCGGKLERLIGAPAIRFKGSGWYATDYAGKSTGGDSSKSEKGGDGAGKAGEAKSTKESKDSAPAKDTKKTEAAKKEK